MRQTVDALTPENARAWALFRTLATRFVFETHSVPTVLSRLTAEEEPELFAETVQRLAVIFDLVYPAKGPSDGA